MEDQQVQSLRAGSFGALLLAVFVVAVGYGFLLPVLPSVVKGMSDAADPNAISRHAGLVTATYTLALFLFAPLWGRFADRYGRHPAILLGLGGFAFSLAIFAGGNGLFLLYLGRFVEGGFAAAVAPAVYALIGDISPSRDQRAHRFALLNIATSLGYLTGPIIGGVIVPAARILWSETFALRTPFLVSAALAALVAAVISIAVPPATKSAGPVATAVVAGARGTVLRLLVLSFLTAAALGAFEVGLTLRGTQVLGMSPYSIGLMFSECMIVMLIMQAIVFSPLIKIENTRWFLTPGLVLLAGSLAALPQAASAFGTAIAVSVVAASAGTLSPLVTYWTSLNAGARQGVGLGSDTAASSLGLAVGSALMGLLFRETFVPNMSFTLVALAVLAGIAASIGLSRRLAPTVPQVRP